MQDIKHIFKNSSEEVKNVRYLFILQVVDKIIPLVVLPYLILTLGAEKYGYIGFSTAFIQYLILLSDFGFNLSSTQRIASLQSKDKISISSVFFSTMYAKTMLLIVGIIIGSIIILLSPSIRIYLPTIICLFPMVVGNILTPSWLFQGIGKIRIPAIITSISRILILPLTFIFVKTSEDYNIAALIQALVSFVAGSINILIIRRMKLVTYMKSSFNNIIKEIKESYPLFLSSVATTLYTQMFTIILGYNSTPASVGRYTAADKIMRSVCFAIYSPISTAFYPRIAYLSKNNPKESKNLIKKLSKIVFLFMGILSICLFFFASPLSSLLSNDFQGISDILKIISPAPIAIALGGILGQLGLIANGSLKQRLQFLKVYSIAGILSILSISILSIYLKEIGAAISLLLTEYLVFILMFYYYRKSIT